MKIVMRPLLALLLMILALSCAEPVTSHTQSMVGASDLRLLTLAERDSLPLAFAMGALSELEFNDETPEFSDIYALCTGIQISPRYVLTASHCKTPVGYVFDRNNITSDADKDKLKFKSFGHLIRAMFFGDLIPSSREALAYKPIPEAVYISKDLDFAIWSFAELEAHSFIDIRNFSRNLQTLALYGHPNGMPLALASNCHGKVHPTAAGRVLHDCDSLNGSSGGLVWDQNSGLPVALHVAGNGNNDADYYKQHGVFESADDLAKICSSPDCRCSRWEWSC